MNNSNIKYADTREDLLQIEVDIALNQCKNYSKLTSTLLLHFMQWLKLIL